MYDACLVLRAPVTLAVIIWGFALGGALWLLPHWGGDASSRSVGQSGKTGRWWVALAGGLAIGSALLVAGWRSVVAWRAAWGLAVAAVGLGVGISVNSLRRTPARTESLPPSADELAAGDPGRRALGPILILATAILLAALSLLILRSDADDVYYVNRSTYIAEHGDFPLRDTLFSNEVWPAQESPPLSSYEPLVGALAHTLHISAADLTYLVVPPLATFLAVMALWRLLRTWRVSSVVLALLGCLLFLLMGGASNASFGNLFVGRIWQGKVLFLSIVIPLLYVHLNRWVHDPRRRHLGLLSATGIAGVGFTPTATFLVPLALIAALSALLVQGRLRPFLAGLIAAAYPVGAGLLIHVAGGLSAGTAAPADTDPLSNLLKVVGAGPMAAIAVVAMLVGWLALGNAAAQVAVAAAAALVVGALGPGVLSLANQWTGAGPVLWRLLWLVPVAPLVGALMVLPFRTHPRAPVVGALLVAAVGGVILASGVPVWSASNHATLTAPAAWKVDPIALSASQRVIALSRPGDIILAPPAVSAIIAISTTRVRAVDPRSLYLLNFASQPGFHLKERQLLDDLAAGSSSVVDGPTVTMALKTLHVALACLGAGDTEGATLLEGAGFAPLTAIAGYECFRSTP